jgi:hypothetical protein
MASWTGITAVTAYSPVPLKQAGYSSLQQNGLAGGLNTIGIVGTIISAQIVDKLGHRICLMEGAAGLFAVNLIAVSLYESTIHNPSKASSVAAAAVTMLFLFNLIYASTWGHCSLPYPNRDLPVRDACPGQRLRYHRLRYRSRLDRAGESHRVWQHQEPNILPFHRSEPHLDSDRLLFLPRNKGTSWDRCKQVAKWACVTCFIVRTHVDRQKL